MPGTLIILPFDHRATFARDLLGVKTELSFEQFKKIVELKGIIFDGFKSTIEHNDYPKGDFGVLVDDLYGVDVINKCKQLGVSVSIPAEKSGQDVFDFEYGVEFGDKIKKINPDYVKVLVRYNPENKDINKTQLERLVILSEFCQKNNFRLLFELLVPMTKEDEAKYESHENFDLQYRHILAQEAILEIKPLVHVDIWKIEGFRKDQWGYITQAINPDSKIIVLGRAASEHQVESWLEDASTFQQVIGFAVGRTIFFDPLSKYLKNLIMREEAVQKIADEFQTYVDLWYEYRKK